MFDFAPEGENVAALGGMNQNRRTSHDPLTFIFYQAEKACCTGVCGALFAAPAGLDYRTKNEYNKANTILVFYIQHIGVKLCVLI